MNRDELQAPSKQAADVKLGFARAWLRKGRLRRAVIYFQEVLELDPLQGEAYIELARIFLHQRRWAEAIHVCEQGLRRFPNQSELHKWLITALAERGTLDDAFTHYELERLDGHPLDIRPDEILCCLVIRNELPRLPFFLDYYRRLGVNHFLVVDNMSEDDTVSFLLNQPDVYLWQTAMSFNAANFGSAWFELLLRRFGNGHWCLTLDADELIVYPGCEERSLAEFCQDLDRREKKAVSGIFLDVYSDKPVRDTHYTPGQDFLEVCHFFDRQWYHQKYEAAGPYHNLTFYFGGARHRVFGDKVDYLVTKVPLIQYGPGTILGGGQHWTNHHTDSIAADQLCVLHFKYFSSFLPYVRQEAAREEHSGAGEQYKQYVAGLDREQALMLYDTHCSVRYKDSRQLVRLGMMKDDLERPTYEFPAITPVPAGAERPFWSVMITVYDRLRFVERVLQSVLQQAADDMQIEVVNDGAGQAFQEELIARVQAIAGDRVHVYCHPDNIGHPHIFNLCIERASGHWVHILHDDDWVRPGYYTAMREGIESNPGVAAAFSRHDFINHEGELTWTSWLERETAGVIEDWLDRIAIECRLQFSSMAVRRSAYESLGGFCPQAMSAWDWEMWKRIAVHYPVWYEPQVLSCTSRDGTAETDRLLRDGQQIADSMATVDITHTYLPEHRADLLSFKARERLALYGLTLAQRQRKEGDHTAAWLNIQQAVRGCPSGRVMNALARSLE